MDAKNDNKRGDVEEREVFKESDEAADKINKKEMTTKEKMCRGPWRIRRRK